MSGIEEAQVTRAVAVLNAAIKHGMAPAGSIPEADGDKIVEAERVIVAAKQAFDIALAAGKGRVPHFPAIVDVLAEGELFLGIGSAEHEAVMAAKAEIDHPGSVDVAAMAQPLATIVPDDISGVGQELPSAPPPSEEESAATGSGESAPPPVVGSTPGDPVKGEPWLDINGESWEIITYSGGQQVEVASSTGEKMIVPRGFLKEIAPAGTTIASSPPPESAPEPLPTPPPPAPPVPPAEPAQVESPPPASTEPDDSDEGDPIYRKVLDQVEIDYSPPSMPVPQELTRPPEEMPDDLTLTDGLPNRRLHSQFNALAARARRLYVIEDAKRRGCKRVLERTYLPPAMRTARAELGKAATITEVRMHAEMEDDSVQAWMERMERHADRAQAYKHFFDMYTDNVEVLSRDHTMSEAEQRGA